MLPAIKPPTQVSFLHRTIPSQSKCILSRCSQEEYARGGISESLPSPSTTFCDVVWPLVTICTCRSKITLMMASSREGGKMKFWREDSEPLSCKWKGIVCAMLYTRPAGTNSYDRIRVGNNHFIPLSLTCAFIGSTREDDCVFMTAAAWCHSSGEVLIVEKKPGLAMIGRCARVRGWYIKGILMLTGC